MNAHQLNSDGLILNTIVVDSLDVFPHLVDASIGGQIGDSIINGVVIPRVIPRVIPDSVPMLNARLVLIAAGLSGDIDDYFASIEGETGEQARAYLAHALTVRRDNAMVEQYRIAKGMTTAQIDDLFIAAAAIPV